MPLVFFLLLTAPCFGRVFVDYTAGLPSEKQLSNITAVTAPGRAAQAEASGYPPREIAVYLSASSLPWNDADGLRKALAEAGRKGRYTLFINIQGLSSSARERVRAQVRDIKNTVLAETPPLSLPADPVGYDRLLFQTIVDICNGKDVILDGSFTADTYAAGLLERTLRPRQKIDVISWEQGRAVLYPDALFMYNEGGLITSTLKRGLFKKNMNFIPKSETGSMPLWENEDRIQMMMLPRQAALWRMQ